jgi:hypothetical protein
MIAAEAKCEFFIRLRETLNKYDSILVGLAASMRSELRALNIEDRAEGTAQRLSGLVKDTEVNTEVDSDVNNTSGYRKR